MAQYCKVVEAVQWFGDVEVAGVCTRKDLPMCPGFSSQPHVHTLEGARLLKLGDWIITGVYGDRSICHPAVFADTYELVDDVQAAGDGWKSGTCSGCSLRGRFSPPG